ncbi:VC_2705 family sodium/solute symporter [Nitrincola nitratireducens]|uniref:Acetate transporter ActP n=1 Tax=Nitrincola nitratireducens TaxID=1229521 RepID=W9UZS1_9GAMM|nr:VC_2705 family sodium/solute symporter [Nitrincola nitratireducens]EXJ09342.1 Acetate transporter ActP [Nitrincola nitratireducens]
MLPEHLLYGLLALISVFVIYAVYSLSQGHASTQFYMAGGRVSPMTNGAAIAADWISAVTFLSLIGCLFVAGQEAFLYMLGWSMGFILLVVLLIPYLRRFGQATVPGFMLKRYQSRWICVMAVLTSVLIALFYLAAQLRGMGIVFSRFLQVPITTAILFAVILLIFYAIMGGIKGVTYTQVIQFSVLIFTFMVPAFFLGFQVTGQFFPQTLPFAEVGDQGRVFDWFERLRVDVGLDAFVSTHVLWFEKGLLVLLLACGTAALPHLIMRFFSVGTPREAQLSGGWALLFIVFFYSAIPGVGMVGGAQFLHTVKEYDGEGLYAAAMPDWVEKWQMTGLLEWQDDNQDGRVRYAQPDDTLGQLSSELSLDADVMALVFLEVASLPSWVIALLASGALAAALASAAGVLMAVSISVSRDLMKKCFTPQMTDRQALHLVRWVSAGLVVLASVFAIFPLGTLIETLAIGFIVSGAVLFPALVCGVYSQRIHAKGVFAGMLFALLLMLGFLIVTRVSLSIGAYWPYSFATFGGVALLSNFLVSGVVSYLTQAPDDLVEQRMAKMRVTSSP